MSSPFQIVSFHTDYILDSQFHTFTNPLCHSDFILPSFFSFPYSYLKHSTVLTFPYLQHSSLLRLFILTPFFSVNTFSYLNRFSLSIPFHTYIFIFVSIFSWVCHLPFVIPLFTLTLFLSIITIPYLHHSFSSFVNTFSYFSKIHLHTFITLLCHTLFILTPFPSVN